jgi:hypothetical protein
MKATGTAVRRIFRPRRAPDLPVADGCGPAAGPSAGPAGGSVVVPGRGSMSPHRIASLLATSCPGAFALLARADAKVRSGAFTIRSAGLPD